MLVIRPAVSGSRALRSRISDIYYLRLRLEQQIPRCDLHPSDFGCDDH